MYRYYIKVLRTLTLFSDSLLSVFLPLCEGMSLCLRVVLCLTASIVLTCSETMISGPESTDPPQICYLRPPKFPCPLSKIVAGYVPGRSTDLGGSDASIVVNHGL